MARRGGKAASRRTRQRKTQRPTQPQPKLAPHSDASSVDELTSTATAATAVAETPVARPAARPASAPRPSRAAGAMVSGPSRLGERAMEEYHYVKRDLRNIGVLVLIMAAVLVVAFVLFNVMGITRAA
jgi:ribonuclease PH